MGRGAKVGQYATTERTYTSEDVDSFGRLIRDFNPLHSSSSNSETNWSEGTENSSGSQNDRDNDEDKDLFELQTSALEAAGLIQFQNDNDNDGVTSNTTTATTPKALVHGIFVSGIFSSIFANIAPGCVYLNQGLDFCAPVFVEDTVVGCIHIERIRDWKRRRKGGIVVQCQTRVYKLLSSSTKKKKKNNNNSCEQRPVEAQLAVKGRANVWLPIGYTTNEDVIN